MTENNPNYYSIIPANVRYDKELTPNAKLLYAEITSLCNMNGKCVASNTYFAKLYGVSNKSISSWISLLCKKNYIFSTIKYKENSKEVASRCIQIATATYGKNLPHPMEKIFHTPMEEIFQDNNTSKLDNNNNLTDSNITYEKENNNEFEKYGEFELVCLSKERYEVFLERFGKEKLDYGIDKLDSWLAKREDMQNKDHFGYFKRSGWIFNGYISKSVLNDF